MKVVRTFHPVGQGAFYSERFHENKEQNVTHNMVYDCGVSIRHEWPMSHVVRQAYTESKRNEILNGIYS